MPRRPKLRRAEMDAQQRVPVLDEAAGKLMAALPDLMDIWIDQARNGNSQAALTLLRLAEQLLSTTQDSRGLALMEEVRKIRALHAGRYE